ncbi:phage protease [Desulfovibrio sp. JC010]|uniref:phage protease n=1 Tax=Desulfovibrio sp. JC010 TaxID=2593641 RepID=UPI0013D4712B|nr:phage protease [Desulfovibrio sp. JC010]NDV27724.1 hypothetical protein [Desulfovibrio sp. JC010]
MKKQFSTNRATAVAICFELGDSKAAPEWVELIPAGDRVEGRDGRNWKNNPEAVLAAFAADLKTPPIDYEHSTEIKGPKGEPAPAVAWIVELEIRDGATWGRVDWNDEGREAVESRKYRYLSPVFSYTKDGVISQLHSAGLTNMPNLHLTALNQENETTEEDVDLKALCKKLGLPEDSSEETVMNRIAELQENDSGKASNSEQPVDLLKYVPRSDYDAAVNRANSFEQKLKDRDEAETDKAINKAVDDAIAAGKIAPANKAFYVASCKAEDGLKNFEEFVKNAPEIVSSANEDKKLETKPGSLTDEERAACRLTGTSEADFLKEKEAK